jgi:TRAP transporter 4TM/12TM fusion protein
VKQEDESAEVSPENQERLQALIDKESKTERTLRGPWSWLTAVMSVSMVLIYFYGAGFQALGTQYHLGVYVLITFVLVFLLYPAGGKLAHDLMAVGAGVLLSVLVTATFFFASPTEFYQQIGLFQETWEYDGLTLALEQDFGNLQYTLLLIPVFAIPLALLDRKLLPLSAEIPSISDHILGAGTAGTVIYWISQFEDLNYRAGAENEVDMLLSIIGLLLSLEICRRVLGWSITLIGIGMICFGLFGPYLPDLLAHRGFRFERLATSLFLTTNGVFGVMANVLATYVILFIFFGAFLQKSGAGRFFIDLPLAVAGGSTGGPAKVAVLSSALFGSVSGSAIANTVSTGSFTIPLMKRAGFRPHVAGAIEPSASIGGMFLPPIMGAGGFLMAELTGISYANIMLMSVGPALLYFLSVFGMIHFEAKKQGLGGLDLSEEVPHWKVVLREGWYYSLPLVIITVLMLIGRSPGNAAFWATLSCIVISWVSKETRMGIPEIWEAILAGAKSTLVVGATIGVIGIIVGTISLTGMGLKFSDLVISMAGDSLLLAVVLIALASLILGMGVPVTAAYLIVAVLAVPALGEYGVSAIAAHMIVYWLSQDSNITPPVCVAAYAGAAIAGSDPWKTGWTSFKFAKLLYIMPLMFAYVPGILLDGTTMEIVSAFVSATLGTLAFSAFSMGFFRRRLKWYEMGVLALATFLLYWPSFETDAVGLVLVLLVWWLQRDTESLTPAPA